MILKIVCCLVILVSCFSFTQNRYEKREEKLEQLKSRNDIKVTEIEPNLLKLEYTNGKILIKNIADYQPQTTQSQQPTAQLMTVQS
jgi:hypothetical protein